MALITIGGKNPIDQARERLRNQGENKENRGFYNTQARNLEVFDTLREEIRQYGFPATSVPSVNNKPIHAKRRSLVLVYSDTHLGLRIESNALGGLGGFNKDVWAERHDRLRDEVIAAQKLFKADELLVFDLGDVMEGQDIFKSQVFNIDLPVPRQIVQSSHRIAEDTRAFAKHFPTIRRHITYGNHGRKGKYGENPYAVNYEYIVYNIAEGLIPDSPHITWVHSDSWYQIVRVFGITFLILHGDTIKKYGANLLAGMRDIRSQYMSMLNIPIDYVVAGHHHQQLADDQCLANGSLVGATEYTAKELSVAGRPSQKIFLVEEGEGITWKKDIALATWDEIRAVRVHQ